MRLTKVTHCNPNNNHMKASNLITLTKKTTFEVILRLLPYTTIVRKTTCTHISQHQHDETTMISVECRLATVHHQYSRTMTATIIMFYGQKLWANLGRVAKLQLGRIAIFQGTFSSSLSQSVIIKAGPSM